MPRILDLDPATYTPHGIHDGSGTWAETNCYSDVVIELLHGMGFEPTAALAFTLTIDFDLDQWTFFKFPHADLEALFALAIFELAPWRPLEQHVAEQVAAGRPVLVELDSFFLPDTVGTAYRREHVKSTVAVNAIDLEAQVMEYFHNQGYHRLEGADFREVFQTEGLVHARMLPPYIEFVKPVPRQAPLAGAALTEGSLALLARHLSRVPEADPFEAFATRLAADSDWLMASELETFHAYSFATLRQLGACYALAARYLGWLSARGVDGLGGPEEELAAIATRAKVLQFKLARAVMRKRALDLTPLAELGEAWQRAMDGLRARFPT